ncbi:CPBP family intramembrane glutamic endopeptidase [Amycolatopsis rifamycinica]|uniref:CAAX protease n=1 Tax=Amycolatopsis rifamycinica TaxID=287986 RepID=A0A066U2V4_9PSEU|nr:type II CAAX endopeptidase family protein [Amycolatopsis rifamycinica]KDN21766.1 CAAX protease [Amycolatopsis rifamycinica]
MSAPPTGIRGFVRGHALTTFFVLANGLSWLAWLPYVLSQNGLGVIGLRFPEVLGSDQVLGVLPGAYLGPVTAAFIVTATADGRAGLRHWAGRLFRWRVNWRWYAGILTAVPVITLLATLALPGALEEMRMPDAAVLIAYLPMLVGQFFTTAVAEEPGWRDFALPRLQRRYSATIGTVVLGVLWGVWHLPLYLTHWGGWPDVTWWQPIEFVAACVPISLAMTWVFNRTHESLPMVMILHASINTVFSLLWPQMFPSLTNRDGTHVVLIASTAAALILLAVTRGKLGLRTAGTAGRAEPAIPGPVTTSPREVAENHGRGPGSA